MSKKLRVLVVDDSAFMRTALARTLGSDPRLDIVGQARDGRDAVDKVRELKPDVVTMDFNMPRMNGAQAIRAIFAEKPVPVVMLSAHTLAGAAETMEALAAGAVDFMTKPDGEVSTDLSRIKDALIEKLIAAAKSSPRAAIEPPPKEKDAQRVAHLERFAHLKDPSHQTLRGVGPEPRASVPTPEVTRPSFTPASGLVAGRAHIDPAVIIAVSTGGPAALESVIPHLPRGYGRGVLVVQHMPAHFTRALAERLDALSPLEVREARDGDRLKPGLVLLAPGDRHVVVEKTGSLKLLDTPPVNGCRPAADVTLQSAAAVYGDKLVVVVMTGMGRDGTLGAAAAKASGARILAQDRATSVVYGMPRAVAEMGLTDEVLPLPRIATRLKQL